MKNTKWISITKAFNDYVESDKLVSLGNSFELLAMIRKLSWRLASTAISSSSNLSNRATQAYNFGKYILRMRKHHGDVYTVSYLKACQLAVQKKIGKDKIKSLRDLVPDLPLPRLTTSALPRYIPLRDRRAISSGNPSTIRWWLTLFSIYRVLDCPGKLKLNTITDPFSGSQTTLDEVSEKLRVLALSFKKRYPKDLSPSSLLWLETSSPSSRTSWTGVFLNLLVLRDEGLLPSMVFFLERTGSYNFKRFFKICMELLDAVPVAYWSCTPPVKDDYFDSNDYSSGAVGQLAQKKEAAGKIRVFALVDVWTQSVLKPLHLWLFGFLKTLPNDGTFDQHASVKRCMEKVALSKKSFGYDLSAATDRLPVALQVSVISAFFDAEFAKHWFTLLVGRSYVMKEPLIGHVKYRYSVGQPMGALSSWAMLAVTHHLIVQMCAKELGKVLPGEWYSNYELLGDDIILFDGDVATLYLSYMEKLGVGITLSKSVVSTNETIEFAKVTGYYGHNVSAISWKMFMSQRSLMGRANIVYSLMNKGIAPSHLIRWFTNITKVGKNSGIGYSYSLLGVLSMFLNSGKLPIATLSKSLTDVLNPRRQAYKNSLIGAPKKRLEDLLVRLGRDLPLPALPAGDRFWYRDEMSMKGAIWEQVESFRVKFDLHQMVTETAGKILDLILPPSATGFFGTDRSRLLDAITQLLIDEAKRPALSVYAATFSTNGIPSYFMGILTEADIDSLGPENSMSAFQQPLDSYWMKIVTDMDTLRTIQELPSRASKKLESKSDRVHGKVDSPLKSLNILLKGRKGWTKQYGG